jgi:hypothetical protein
MKKVQEDMSYYDAWVETESSFVAKKYRELITSTRRISGKLINTAWSTPAITQDDQMNIVGVDLSAIAPFERAYLNAVRDHLSLWPVPTRRLLRVIARHWPRTLFFVAVVVVIVGFLYNLRDR